MTGSFDSLRQLQRSIAGLGRPGGSGNVDLLQGIRTEVKGLLVGQFSAGIGPDGAPWKDTVRGKPALVSRRLPAAFLSRIDQGAVRFVGWVKRQWLEAHQFGHVFKTRAVADRANVLRFSKRGKLISQARQNRQKYGRAVFARAHTVGQRVLPARQIYPEGTLTPRWEAAVGRGITSGMMRWYERAK